MSDDNSVQDNAVQDNAAQDSAAQTDAVEAAEQAASPATADATTPPAPADAASDADAASSRRAAKALGDEPDGTGKADEADEADELEFDDAEVLEPAEPSLEEKLEQAQATIKATRNKMLRIAADFENFRKRSTREVDDARKRGTLNAVKDLLPVFDNLDRATTHVEETAETAAFVEGLKLVHKQFLDVIGKMGIERINALGRPFDPNLHESIQHLNSDDHDAGIVMAEVQPGYRMKSTLLRPAMVVVSRGPAPSESAAEPAAADDEVDQGETETSEASEETEDNGPPTDADASGDEEGTES